MKFEVRMPKMGESLTEGTIVKWMKKVGDKVEKDETLLEISTDKVDSEIPSPVDGILKEIVAEEQVTVEVDAILATIETETGMSSGQDDHSGKRAKKEKKSELKMDEKVKHTKSEKTDEKSHKSAAGGNVQDVAMPKMGESLTEGTIVKWWKKPGDKIERDETLLEISTDKVDSEIPSPVDGVVKELLFQENDTVEVGQVLATIETEQEIKQVSSVEKKETEEKQKAAVSPAAPAPEETVKTRKSDEKGRFYSPLVRTIADKENVSMQELENIPGSGKGSRVTKRDILQYLDQRTEPADRKAVAGQPPLSAAGGRTEIIPMDHIRKQIAQHMKKSLDTAAHVYSVSECDMTDVMNLMYARRPDFEKQEGFKLTVTPFILHAVVKALQDFPRVNASLEGDNIILKRDINIGIAVAAPRGLIVPVVKHAEEKSFTGLARAVSDLVKRARGDQLQYEDVEGSTFSVTNYGIFGNIIGLPIINQPNVAILGVGAIKKRPVVLESEQGDSIAVRSMTYISMSYDHRLVDGELGGRFMQRLVEYLEHTPENLF